MNETVTVILPAYNEGPRIAGVLKALIRARKKGIVDDIIVVNDGSTDETAREAGKFEVKLINLKENRGKGAALAAGIGAAKTDVILFLDADLVGLRISHVQKLLLPIVNNKRVGMTIGLFRKSGFVANLGNMMQLLSGQRAVRRSWVSEIAGLSEPRYGVDALITKYARKRGVLSMRIYLDGLQHVYKEQKNNAFVGFFHDRLKMYYEILRTLIKSVE